MNQSTASRQKTIYAHADEFARPRNDRCGLRLPIRQSENNYPKKARPGGGKWKRGRWRSSVPPASGQWLGITRTDGLGRDDTT